MAANYVQVLNGILRGKALDIIDDLTVVPDLQESLRLSSSVSLLEDGAKAISPLFCLRRQIGGPENGVTSTCSCIHMATRP